MTDADRFLRVDCPKCGAKKGEPCKDVPLPFMRHNARRWKFLGDDMP